MSSAISFAISIDPKNVIKITVITAERKVPDFFTIARASIVKNFIFFKAQTTAKVQNKQVKVLKSKYPIYSLSGGTAKQVMTAKSAAVHKTALCFIKVVMCWERFLKLP